MTQKKTRSENNRKFFREIANKDIVVRVLIVSDTHRSMGTFLELAEKWAPLDLVIHCGDIEGDEYVVWEAVDCPVEIVQGNNDFFSDLPRERQLEIGKYQVLITHGHQYHVSTGHEFLAKEAAARRIDMVMYGHTHRPVIEKVGSVLVMNPGSLTYPRQSNRKASYIIMEMDHTGEPEFQIHYV